MRVVHVNDVAGVGSAAVDQARAEGLDWLLWPLPAVRGASLPTKVVRRVRDLVRFRPTGRAADLLHVHYGLFGYYAWSVRRRYLLHLHGTDVRSTIDHRLLGPWVRQAISRASAVVYSTPDLADRVRALRPDALWVPAPLSPDVCSDRAAVEAGGRAGAVSAAAGDDPDSPARPARVVFSSRWEPVKGLDTLVDIAGRLRAARPEVELIGVDWGEGASGARRAGVDLLPFMSGHDFRALLASADVVVGQQSDHALVVVADLEAMALRRPVVAKYLAEQFYGDEAPVWNTAAVDPVQAVLEILDDPQAAVRRADAGREWALLHHSPRRFIERVSEVYASIG